MKKISSFTLDEKTLTVFCEVADKFCINKSKLIERLIKE